MQQPLRLALGFAIVFLLHAAQGHSALQLTVQRGYLPGIPTLVRVDADPSIWDSTATLSVDHPGISLSSNQVVLRNGRGSTLVTISGAADFTLTAAIGPLNASRSIRALTNENATTIAGALTGATTTWSGIIQITNDLTIPPGHTLTILSNTLVLVNGVPSGTTAPDILVSGTIQSLGTADYPVTITCANAAQQWGQIRHNNAQPSVFRYTSINRAGRAGGEGHVSEAGLAMRTGGSRILFDHSNITDLSTGKVMYASGSDLTFNGCLISRAVMGPELQSTALLITNTHFVEFRWRDDADALYVNGPGANQRVHIIDSIIGYTDDDGLDTLNANMTIERCIFRNINSGVDPDGKGISIFNRAVHLNRCIIADCITSISAKSSTGATTATLVTINECTILGTSNSVVAAWKSNAQSPLIDYRITNSILRSIDPVRTDFGPTNFTIAHCNVSEVWPGTGNQTDNPRFMGAYDFHLQSSSPCIDAGMGTDPDGSARDIGAFTFTPPPPVLDAPVTGQFVLNAFPNRNYVVEYSHDLEAWAALGTYFQTNAANLIQDPSLLLLSPKFYRARLAP